MTTERYLDEWRAAGIISAPQHAALTAVVRKDRFSVFLELNALLYLGVVAFGAGVAWTVREHFANLGDAAILLSLAALFGGSLFYCFTRSAPFSRGQVESPTFAFDYVLYLGSLAFGTALGYVEYRFQLLQGRWDDYLLASAALYFFLAYRFDNRFVLSLALSTLAGWFGVRLSAWNVLPSGIRSLAVVYGVVVAGIGVVMHRTRIKAHFLDAYLHIGANAVLLALTSGAMDRGGAPWLVALLIASAVAVTQGVRVKRFAFVVYGVVYGYVGSSAQFVQAVSDATLIFTYFVVSGLSVVAALAVLSRRSGHEG